MAIPWADFFAPPVSVAGFTTGNQTAMDEWPFLASDNAFVQDTAGQPSTPILNFNLSAAPGDKKGFVLWLGLHCDSVNGYSLDEIRIKDGTTLLYTDTNPSFGPLGATSILVTSMRLYYYQIPDSVWSGDPDIDNLNIEIDVTNLHSANNRLRFSGARLSKSPFTAAQEADLPSTLAGQTFSCYRAVDLYTLGGVDDETIVVWPDASGRGMHMLQWEVSGTAANLHDDDGEYVDFPEGSGTHFLGAFGLPIVTGNIIFHARTYFYEGSVGGAESRVIIAHSRANIFPTLGVPGDKHVLALDANSGDAWVIMSGDGSGGAHLHSAGGSITLDTWIRPTYWIQNSGNEHLWEDDVATPLIDGVSGANDLTVWGFAAREDFNSARHLEGRVSELWVVDAGSKTEANIDDARDEWLNGIGGPITVTASPATLVSSAHAGELVPPPDPITITASPAIVASTAIASVPTPAGLVIAALPATLVSTAIACVPPNAAITIVAEPAILTAVAFPVTNLLGSDNEATIYDRRRFARSFRGWRPPPPWR